MLSFSMFLILGWYGLFFKSSFKLSLCFKSKWVDIAVVDRHQDNCSPHTFCVEPSTNWQISFLLGLSYIKCSQHLLRFRVFGDLSGELNISVDVVLLKPLELLLFVSHVWLVMEKIHLRPELSEEGFEVVSKIYSSIFNW